MLYMHRGEILPKGFVIPFGFDANRLARYFGTTPEFWINPETHGDLSISRRRRKRRFNRTEGRTKVEATPC
jgi:plasmid maintenance system antidote protein VapI